MMLQYFSPNKMLFKVFVVVSLINITTCEVSPWLPVEIQVNGEHQNDLKLIPNKDKSIWEGTYNYFEGELVRFTCKNKSQKNLWIKITSNAQSYENTSISTEPFEITFKEGISLTVKLSKENNNNNINCFVGEKAESINYHVIINLMYGETSNEAILMNGLPANIISCDVPDIHKKCYVLESYNQENVSEMRKVLENNPNIRCELEENDSNLECKVSNNGYIHKIVLHLVDNLAAKFVPNIIGLSMLRTQAMYFYNSWSLVILYAYYPSDTFLHLLCKCKNKQCAKWIIDERKINDTQEINIVSEPNNCMNKNLGRFILKTRYVFGEIVCKCENDERDTTTTIRLVKQGIDKLDPLAQHADPKNVTRWSVIGIIVVMLLVIITVVAYIIFKHHKGNKSPALLRNMADPNGEHHTSTINANDEIQYTVSYQPDEKEIISKSDAETDNNIGKAAKSERDIKSKDALKGIDVAAENSVGPNISHLYKYSANARSNSETTSENARKNDQFTGNEVTYAELSLNASTGAKPSVYDESPYACLDLNRSK